MKHLLIVVVTLALISLTMRYLASTAASKAEAAAIPVAEEHAQPKPPPEISSSGDLVYVLGSKPTPIPVAPEQHSRKTNPKHFVCRLPAEEPLYQKVGPYHSQEELREDLKHRELWIWNLLAAPVRRKGQPVGVQIRFKTPTPFARLGLRSGDVLMSLNQVVTHQVEDLPALLDEMKSAPSLHFRLERKGVLVPLDVQLR
jgi:hypothetical protein